MAGAMDTSGHHIAEFLPAPVDAGHQGVTPGQRDVPVLAVLGAPGKHPPQIHRRARDIGQRGEVPAGHRVGEQVAALEIDRDHVGGQFADLAAGHRPGRGQRPRGLVEVFGFLAGHQADPDLVPRRARPHPEHLGQPRLAPGFGRDGCCVRGD